MSWKGPRPPGEPSPPYKGSGSSKKKLTKKGKEIRDKAKKIRSDKQGINITKEEKRQLYNYSLAGYIPINDYLRGVDKKLQWPDKYKPMIATLDRLSTKSKLVKDMILYREIKLSKKEVSMYMDQIKVGNIIEDRGFVSTCDGEKSFNKTFGKSVSKSFIRFKIETKKGQNGFEVGDLSWYPSEKEVLLPRNSKFKITKINKIRGQFNISLKLLNRV